ncbi:hypothetical protein AM571_CH00771 [Rhizobium etli 8C-3]|uniref:Uncharacterized protein DUF4174 n=2 Tax=Rhizobium TaxID=379 RepID=A0A4R3QZK9_9HYPH|nr:MULTISPECIES: DUF4174 domain-containing protein [Rhizobium]APO73616.1 hypothetical protein AM571_CH00771 [Rhizobium etli 8C-3]TCU28040.1 uncharacterized protein DUF4174 [Rhizobium azibense]TCU37162.1 uncharacterized protein DUF4174 [Rhizobium azibense]
MSKTHLYGATKVEETQGGQAPVASLEEFRWKSRVLVIFADTDNSRAARQENQLLADRTGLQERDMVVFKISGSTVKPIFGAGGDLNETALRKELRGPEAGEFAAALVGKDGTVKLKVSEPVSNGELFAIIDSMPMRAAEALKPDR